MKRFLAIQLLILYLGLTVISSVNLHYCHDNLKGIYFSNLHDNCCEEHVAISGSCCKNIIVSIDFETDQVAAAPLQIKDIFNAIIILYSQEDIIVPAILSQKYSENELPPGSFSEKFYKLNHSFLFYG